MGYSCILVLFELEMAFIGNNGCLAAVREVTVLLYFFEYVKNSGLFETSIRANVIIWIYQAVRDAVLVTSYENLYNQLSISVMIF